MKETEESYLGITAESKGNLEERPVNRYGSPITRMSSSVEESQTRSRTVVSTNRDELLLVFIDCLAPLIEKRYGCQIKLFRPSLSAVILI